MSMEIVTLPLGDYQTNCYLVADGAGICAVIDPGYSPEAVLSEAARRRWQIRAVLLTHGHFDHVGGVRGIAEATDCPVYLHENDRSLPPWLTAGMPDDTQAIKEGDMICVGELRFSVLETPGHTPGSVCLRCGDALFTGDTLFAGSCGRTDLGGNWSDLTASLRRLSEIESELRVFPGHGAASTLSIEKCSNPYLQDTVFL